MNNEFSEQEWLVFSEKMFRMIATVHGVVRDFLATPTMFYHDPDPVAGKVAFTVEWYAYGEDKYGTMKFSMLVEDWTVSEILDEVKLAFHASEVWRP